MGTGPPPQHPQFLILMHYYFIFSAGGASGECTRPTVVWSIQSIVTISFRSSFVH